MDWELAIRRNREALERVLAALFALVGLPEGWPTRLPEDATLPRYLHVQAMHILRAAESAIRRLVLIAAHEVTVSLRPAGGALPRDFGGKRQDGPVAMRIPAFPLLDPLRKYPFDPPRRASKSFPRICVVGYSEPTPIPEKPVVSPDDPVDAAGLYRRLASSRRALANLPAQARRLARWYQRNKLKPGPRRVSPLRIGRPPGCRKHRIHAVDDILKECQVLALDVLSPPDTS